MSRFELEISGYNEALNEMTINGEQVKFVRSEKGKRKVVLEDVEDRAEIVIYKTHRYAGKAWLLWNLFCYLISIFGIFDLRHEGAYRVVECVMTIDVPKDTFVAVQVNKYQDGIKLLEVTTEDTIYQETLNRQYKDKEAYKRHNTMKKVKIGTFFAVVAIGVLIVVLIVL